VSTPGSMTRLGEDLRSPDPRVRNEAARRIWERYSARLLVLVRRKLDERVRRRTDEDDVLQSMYKSFCIGRRSDQGPLLSRDDLWRLLVHITMCKIANAANRERAARRDVRRDQPALVDREGDGPSPRWMLEMMDRSEPTPAEALALEEELEAWLKPLPEDLRQVALWKLEGYTNREIGVMIERTERTVELKMRIIRRCLETRLSTTGVREPS
jgi:RNA polymerase sigma-70 factor (ECF subfamily)